MLHTALHNVVTALYLQWSNTLVFPSVSASVSADDHACRLLYLLLQVYVQQQSKRCNSEIWTITSNTISTILDV